MLSTIIAIFLYFLPSISFSTSQKGGKTLTDSNHYRYGVKAKNGKGTIWRCADRSCKARLYTDPNDELLGDIPTHEHPNRILKNTAKDQVNQVMEL